MLKHYSTYLVVSLFIACIQCVQVGILYEGWHAFAVAGMNEVLQKGGEQLTVEDVIRSEGKHLISDIYDKYNVTQATTINFYYQAKPQAGFYCLYEKRQNETGWGVPDCANITSTALRHAEMLVSAGIDFVVVDATNIPTMSAQGDVLQLRPLELLFENWAALRTKGIKTPKISVWGCLPAGATLWQNYLTLYNNPNYADLVYVDEFTGKKVFFTTETPDPGLLTQVESNSGNDDVIVQPMWAEMDNEHFINGTWSFFSECRQNGTGGTSVVGVDCEQLVTVNAKIGPTGTQMSVCPSYQVLYGSMAFISPGKLAGLTFKKQFYNAFQALPDYIFISSFNEFISQGQPNPFNNPLAISMGLADDPQGTMLFVDTYGYEFSRDIEPDAVQGSYIFDIMASCIQILKSDNPKCTNESSLCCQSSDFFTNIYSLSSIASPDYMVTNSRYEMAKVSPNYNEICYPFSGSTVFCIGNSPNPQIGPFIIYSQKIYDDLIALYRCYNPTKNSHFISNDPKCEGATTDYQLGFISSSKGRETYRPLYRCLNSTSLFHFHSVDLNCPSSDVDPAGGLLGYVR